jgi:hypothetical protein
MEDRAVMDRSVCSLNDEELEERRARVRAEILPAVERADRIEGGFAVETEDSPEMRERLTDLVTLERRCCSSVDWDLRELPGAGRLRLEVRGLDPGSALLGSLLEPPASETH